MNYQELELKKLESCVYLITGDKYLIKDAIKKIASKNQVQQINISIFNAENFSALDVSNTCNQFSFFAEKRIVFVDSLEKELNTNDKNIFSTYVKSPNSDCILLLENNNNLFGFLKGVENIDCKAGEAFVIAFIQSEFSRNGKSISQLAIKALYSYTLGDFSRVKNEVKKICDYLGEKTEVSIDDVDLLVFKDSELKVFDLTVALSEKNIQKAHKVLYDMLKSGEPPIKILGLISSHFRRLFFAKINKGTNAELAKALNCKEYAIVKARQQAEGYSAKSLKEIQNLILEADYNIKSGEMTQENTLYYLIFAISNKS